MEAILNKLPLVVDLDGTLVKTDIFIEAIIGLLKDNVFYCIAIFFWLFFGKAHVKEQIAKRVKLDPTLLPYNQEFLAYLNKERQKGRYLILASATNQVFAKKIADYLGIFDLVIASGSKENLSGKKKLKAILQYFSKFVYAGNHHIDFPIWQSSAGIIIPKKLTTIPTTL